ARLPARAPGAGRIARAELRVHAFARPAPLRRGRRSLCRRCGSLRGGDGRIERRPAHRQPVRGGGAVNQVSMVQAPASGEPDRPRLGTATLASLPAQVRRPAYDREATRIGVVHFGPGAFHRAHQAVYLDDLLGEDPDWAICAVSLHNPGVRDALQPQDGLYTLALLGEQPSLRVIGSIREVLCAPQQRRAVMARLVDPQVRLVTLTITEKGYCLAPDGVDAAHPDITRDLVSPEQPISAIGWLVAGLRERRAKKIAPYTVLSCDNLADNG